MKKTIYFIALGCTSFCFSALAETESTIKAICDHITKTKTQSADYVPGVDVHGRPVVRADLNSNASNFLSDPIVIPLEVDLVQRFGLTLPADINLQPTISNIKIYNDGRVRYNDDEDVSDRILQKCHDYKKTENNQTQEHRQKGHDPVLSSDDHNDKIEGQYPPRYNQ